MQQPLQINVCQSECPPVKTIDEKQQQLGEPSEMFMSQNIAMKNPNVEAGPEEAAAQQKASAHCTKTEPKILEYNMRMERLRNLMNPPVNTAHFTLVQKLRVLDPRDLEHYQSSQPLNQHGQGSPSELV